MSTQTSAQDIPAAGLRGLPAFMDLIRLTKPGVTGLLVFTALATAWAGSGPWVSLSRLGLLALAGGLTAGGGAALNQYLERDLDAQMPRTRNRPLPSGRLPFPCIALIWGFLLITAGLTLSALTLPPETTMFILAGCIVYVPLYTLWLKRRTPWAVVIGGAAGSFPVLAGWATVRGDWPLMPLALASFVFFWTPAHFWAFAITHHRSYQWVGFPMLPNIVGFRSAAAHILAHALMAVLAALLSVAGWGWATGVVGLTGLGFLWLCVLLWRDPTLVRAYRLYRASNYYLLAVFLSLALTR